VAPGLKRDCSEEREEMRWRSKCRPASHDTEKEPRSAFFDRGGEQRAQRTRARPELFLSLPGDTAKNHRTTIMRRTK